VQRLFSMFPDGWPGAGLILLRATAAIPLLRDCGTALLVTRTPVLEIMDVAGLAIAALLLAGLFTPVSGLLVGAVEICFALLPLKIPSAHVTIGVLGIALAMIGPGAWSLDARLFGRKRIQIRLRSGESYPVSTPRK
jgi:putative oxidoreductase